MPPPPENPTLVPEVARIRRNAAVGDVMKFVGDGPDARDLWLKLWNICDQKGHLPIWDEAIRQLAKEIKTGSKPVRSKGAWLQDKMRRLLEAKGVFVPKAGDDDPEDVRRLIAESYPASNGVTPLETIYGAAGLDARYGPGEDAE